MRPTGLRSSLIRVASDLPRGSSARRQILSVLKQSSEEIDVQELPPDQARLVGIVGMRPEGAQLTASGYVVDFSPGGAGTRLEKGDLKRIVAHPDFRWLELHRDGLISVGM